MDKFDLEKAESILDIPACRAAEVLSILVELDPVEDKEDEKNYVERVEKFSNNLIWRKITGNVTAEFIEATVERMFNSDEVTSTVSPIKLRELKRRIINLFL